MKLFTIHVRRFGINPEIDVCAVREGFHVWAFIFTFIWSVFKGYWLLSVALVVINLLLGGILSLLDMDLVGHFALNLGFHLMVGFYANDMARWTLKRRGYMEEDILSAHSSDQAVEQYILSGAVEAA